MLDIFYMKKYVIVQIVWKYFQFVQLVQIVKLVVWYVVKVHNN